MEEWEEEEGRGEKLESKKGTKERVVKEKEEDRCAVGGISNGLV